MVGFLVWMLPLDMQLRQLVKVGVLGEKSLVNEAKDIVTNSGKVWRLDKNPLLKRSPI